MDQNGTMQTIPQTRKEKKAARKEAKRLKYQGAPAFVRAWHMWLKYVVLALVIIAIAFAAFVFAAIKYVQYENQKMIDSLVFPEAGDQIVFTTKDLDGNEVKSEELFRGHDLTLLNVWATWCGPCKRELPELGKLAKDFEEKNCQIIGVCMDGDEEAETARQLLKEAGAEYPNIIAPKNMMDVLPVVSIPTTYYFDSEGHLIGEPTVGAYVEEYPKRVDEILSSAK